MGESSNFLRVKFNCCNMDECAKTAHETDYCLLNNKEINLHFTSLHITYLTFWVVKSQKTNYCLLNNKLKVNLKCKETFTQLRLWGTIRDEEA